MDRLLRKGMLLTALTAASFASAQRYLTEVFTNAQLTVTSDVTYGTNIDFMTSDLSTNPPTINTIDLKFDVYAPSNAADALTDRPVIVYAHTGNILPPPLNGSPCGTKLDSSAVEMCMRMARRGYVAVCVDYRNGWNPLGSTLEERRGTLLNGVYRAIQDIKQAVRTLRADAAATNTYHIDPNKIVLFGEGTGGYLVQAYITLNHGYEMFIEKFRPDPFNPAVSYIDTTHVGNIEGFGGDLNMYTDNGFASNVQMAVNMGGALADSTWMEGGEPPLVSFHTVFDPFAPFTDGIVIVPTTGEQVVDVSGSNHTEQLANILGNNAPFATLPDLDPYTHRARSLYGTTQTHTNSTVHIRTNVEGLFPFVTPDWPAAVPGTFEEASPWQWWDPNSAIAQTVVAPPNITADMASRASNPNMSAAKGRAYIDTIMGYANPRIVCTLDLGPCSLVGINENDPIAVGVAMYPNPAHDRLSITSEKAVIRAYEVYDVNGRRLRNENVERNSFFMPRGDLKAGVYFVQLHFDEGTVTRKVVLD